MGLLLDPTSHARGSFNVMVAPAATMSGSGSLSSSEPVVSVIVTTDPPALRLSAVSPCEFVIYCAPPTPADVSTDKLLTLVPMGWLDEPTLFAPRPVNATLKDDAMTSG